jgi:hypothetical protein
MEASAQARNNNNVAEHVQQNNVEAEARRQHEARMHEATIRVERLQGATELLAPETALGLPAAEQGTMERQVAAETAKDALAVVNGLQEHARLQEEQIRASAQARNAPLGRFSQPLPQFQSPQIDRQGTPVKATSAIISPAPLQQMQGFPLAHNAAAGRTQTNLRDNFCIPEVHIGTTTGNPASHSDPGTSSSGRMTGTPVAFIPPFPRIGAGNFNLGTPSTTPRTPRKPDTDVAHNTAPMTTQTTLQPNAASSSGNAPDPPTGDDGASPPHRGPPQRDDYGGLGGDSGGAGENPGGGGPGGDPPDSGGGNKMTPNSPRTKNKDKKKKKDKDKKKKKGERRHRKHRASGSGGGPPSSSSSDESSSEPTSDDDFNSPNSDG